MSSSSREIILNQVRHALTQKAELNAKPDLHAPIYFKPANKSSLDFFTENFQKTKGQLFLCKNEAAFPAVFEPLVKQKAFNHIFAWEEKIISLLNRTKVSFSSSSQDNFVQADLGVTSCESLIARTGSILFSSATASGRRLSIFPHTNLVIAYTSQLKEDIIDGLKEIKTSHKELPSMISLTSGPSRTADIEKTLVLGAHGPKELILILINDTSI
ncbi:MAG TPA: LUD domain-containing protein [Cytophagaceae bacterium]|jgi:L-lactate dehydrogenase complex protein LldG|nr:LUD domain-containing protein [Cytophagaceae bacterium]